MQYDELRARGVEAAMTAPIQGRNWVTDPSPPSCLKSWKAMLQRKLAMLADSQ